MNSAKYVLITLPADNGWSAVGGGVGDIFDGTRPCETPLWGDADGGRRGGGDETLLNLDTGSRNDPEAAPATSCDPDAALATRSDPDNMTAMRSDQEEAAAE